MRKIIMFNRVSIDGFFAGSKGEMDWFVMDHEIDKTAHEIMEPDTENSTLVKGDITKEVRDLKQGVGGDIVWKWYDCAAACK
ncbi:hypothetical protein [Paenibacillus sp. SYP-B3998]|uniref:hypothetical protein n=1 Tax=Paenibacillus sp. SYP-B3998 TaxID=2678564 RepID=UPI001F085D21|nr:hypothetical protein [Paenibacillus sp. SYP-B3998]